MFWLAAFCLVIGGALGVAFGRRSAPTQAMLPEAENPPAPPDSERQLLRIVEALPLGVLVFDEAGHQLFANGAAARLSEDRLHNVLVTSAIEEIVAQASTSPGLVVQRMLELYGAPKAHLSIRGLLVGASVVGQSAVVVTIEDATELRSADLLRREFVANVSHELKTPIGAISVLAETLLDVEEPAVGRRLASRLQNEALRLASTVDDLLTLARIESGEQVDLTTVRLGDVLAAVAGRVGILSEARSAKLVVDIEPPDLEVIGDRVQLVSGLGKRFAEDDPPSQFVHMDDLASAIVIAVRQRLDGVYNVAPDGWVAGERVRALSGERPRLPLPERAAEVLGSVRWRFQRGPIPPGLRSYTHDAWVVSNGRLVDQGWTPTVTNEQAYVEGTEARWWTMVSPKRRQELALGSGIVMVVASLLVAAVLGRRWLNRR